jgi:23S rRNA pseudouridine2605 synthase
VRGQPVAGELARLCQGLQLADGPAHFVRVEPLRGEAPGDEGSSSGSHSWFRVALREGRNREVRRLWQAAGYEVSRLKRVRYGSVSLPEGLRPGQWLWLAAGKAARL